VLQLGEHYQLDIVLREITLIKHDYRASNKGASKGLTSQAIHKFM